MSRRSQADNGLPPDVVHLPLKEDALEEPPIAWLCWFCGRSFLVSAFFDHLEREHQQPRWKMPPRQRPYTR